MKAFKFSIALIFFIMSPFVVGLVPFVIFGKSLGPECAFSLGGIYCLVWMYVWAGFFDEGRKLGEWLLLP